MGFKCGTAHVNAAFDRLEWIGGLNLNTSIAARMGGDARVELLLHLILGV